jgi:hypothetical protein
MYNEDGHSFYGKGNSLFLFPLQGQALRVFQKISTLRVVFFEKTLHRKNRELFVLPRINNRLAKTRQSIRKLKITN